MVPIGVTVRTNGLVSGPNEQSSIFGKISKMDLLIMRVPSYHDNLICSCPDSRFRIRCALSAREQKLPILAPCPGARDALLDRRREEVQDRQRHKTAGSGVMPLARKTVGSGVMPLARKTMGSGVMPLTRGQHQPPVAGKDIPLRRGILFQHPSAIPRR